jgi:hypothetical protein
VTRRHIVFAARTIEDEKNVVKNIERWNGGSVIKKVNRFAVPFMATENVSH